MTGELRTRGWDHTSLAVADLDTAIAFYGRALGYEVTWEERGWAELIQGYLGRDGVTADLVQLRRPDSAHTLELIAFHGLRQDADPLPTRPGMAHLCFRVDDVEAAMAEIEKLGGQMIGAITEYPLGGRGCYVREPSGTFFELDEAPLNT